MLWNHDNVFFEVTSSDVHFDTVAAEDVISLEIDEEVGKLDTGTLVLLDRNHIYSRIIRPGAKLNISWGNRPFMGLETKREHIEVRVNSPGGSGDEGGVCTYNCSFMATEFRGDGKVVWYETGKKQDVVAAVLTRLNVLPPNQEINFAQGLADLSAGTMVGQHESDFRFLVRMANEWHAAFRIGRDKKGLPCACFIDHALIPTSLFALKVGGRVVTNFVYGAVENVGAGFADILDANVRSYTWQDRSMDSALGQGFQIVSTAQGYSISRVVVEDEVVTTWRLDVEKIERELGVRTPKQQLDLIGDWMNVKSFDQIQNYFIADVTTTAPQGSGIEVELEVMGDPELTALMTATFGKGFPDKIGAAGKSWWIRKVSHKISTAGYFTSVSVCDAYAMIQAGIFV
jgi:hypothetical protein